MGVIIRRTIGNLVNAAQLTRDDFQQVGLLIRENILQRTRQGVDANYQRFAPYSQEYAKARAKEGLTRDAVKLELSGEMLRAIKVDAQANKVTVTF